MTRSAENAGPDPEDAIHPDWTVTPEDIRRWHATHPETFPGFDVAPIILNERRQAAAHKVRATWPDLPEVLIADALPKLSDHRKSMADELGDLIDAYHQLPRRDDNAVALAPLARREPGRPRWTRAPFLEHLHKAESDAGPRHRLADVAASFRALDGGRGVSEGHLRKLRRRFRS